MPTNHVKLNTREADQITVTHDNMQVTFFYGEDDGVPVVQIDTDDAGPIRVNVNDAPVFDGRTDDNASAGRGWRA